MRFFANEMVYASTPISLAGARRGLNVTSNILRTWHERLLFGSSTEEVAAGSIQYQAHGALPVYRSTPRVQQVRLCLLLTFHRLNWHADCRTSGTSSLEIAIANQILACNKFLAKGCDQLCATQHIQSVGNFDCLPAGVLQ